MAICLPADGTAALLTAGLAREGCSVGLCARDPSDLARTVAELRAEGVQAHGTVELPYGRLGTAEEVAAVVAFLLSERASWVTGAHVRVDGAQGRASPSAW